MNDSLYEDYMRSVLGYQRMNNYPNTYNNTNYDNYERYDYYAVPTMSPITTNQPMTAMSNIQIHELENCYPDIYKIIYPMIQRVCTQNSRAITKEVIETMTDEIYYAIEDNEMTQSRGNDSKETKNVTTSNKKTEENENRQRVVNNPALRDLITILLLRELIGRPGGPGRPPIGPRPPRPPMRPPMHPPMRPPMRPQPRGDMEAYNNREYFSSLDDGYDLYEY